MCNGTWPIGGVIGKIVGVHTGVSENFEVGLRPGCETIRAEGRFRFFGFLEPSIAVLVAGCWWLGGGQLPNPPGLLDVAFPPGQGLV